jgi:uncharacterized protein (TIGR01777 family)
MNDDTKHILIAGGTGLIGKKLQTHFLQAGHRVSILTRNKKLTENSVYRLWNPDDNFIQENALSDIDVLINLCGAGIADKPWSDARKKELHDSRVKPALVLLEEAKKSGKIKHYVSASGINCYPVNTNHVVIEKDSYGTDYLSRLVKEWETAALQFEELCPVTLLRISAVLSDDGGALAKMKPLFKWGLGAPLGTGKQPFTWIHEDDLVATILHLVENKLAGAYNICGETVTNRHFSKALAKSVNRWMLPIPVPAFMMKLMLGEMSEMLLNGVNADASKLKNSGFTFLYPTIEKAMGRVSG